MKKYVAAKKKRLELHFYEKKVKNNCELIINQCTHTLENQKPTHQLMQTYQSHERNLSFSRKKTLTHTYVPFFLL
jgi:hypothetical protein